MNLLGLLSGGMGIMAGVSSYKESRSQGNGRLKSALGAYINGRVQSDPWVMAATMSVPLIKKFAIERPTQGMRSVRRNFSVFSKGMMPDNEMLGQMQGAQMQSCLLYTSDAADDLRV